MTLTLDSAHRRRDARSGARSRCLPAPFRRRSSTSRSPTFAKDRYLVRGHVDGFATLPELETNPASPKYGEIIGPEADLVA